MEAKEYKSTLEQLEKYNSSKKWLKTIKSEATRRKYIDCFMRYLNTVNKTPDELLGLKVTGLKNTATELEFIAEQTLQDYLNDNTNSAHINLIVLNAVKSFYTANWRSLNRQVGKDITVPEPKQRTPSLNDLLKMESYARFNRDKALIWLLESTSARQGEALQLKWGDLKPTEDLLRDLREKHLSTRTLEEDKKIVSDVPYYLQVEAERLKGSGIGKYAGIRHVAFIHRYAAKKLEDYKYELKQRGLTADADRPIFVALETNQYCQKGEVLVQVQSIFIELSNMTWKDKSKKYSAHDLRDLLQNALENANVHDNYAYPMLAHKVKGVSRHYSNHEVGEFLLKYVTTLPWMLPDSLEETQKKLVKYRNIEEENQILSRKVDDLYAMMERVTAEMGKKACEEEQKLADEAERAERAEIESEAEEERLKDEAGYTERLKKYSSEAKKAEDEGKTEI